MTRTVSCWLYHTLIDDCCGPLFYPFSFSVVNILDFDLHHVHVYYDLCPHKFGIMHTPRSGRGTVEELRGSIFP
jgi:hypothetical protein